MPRCGSAHRRNGCERAYEGGLSGAHSGQLLVAALRLRPSWSRPGETAPTVSAAVGGTAGRHRAGLRRRLGTPALWGVVFGAVQAASPLAFWWLDAATVYAIGLALIASIYIGFAVADGRATVIAVESGVAGIFVVVAAAAVTGSPWLLVLGLTGHGLKDLWQHHSQFVANTRWWPPFCLVVDWVAAAIIAVEIASGVGFHS